MERVYTALAPRGLRDRGGQHRRGAVPTTCAPSGRSWASPSTCCRTASSRIQQIYQTTGVPESFLLDRQGVIVKRIIGAHDWNSPANRALVERLLDEPGT